MKDIPQPPFADRQPEMLHISDIGELIRDRYNILANFPPNPIYGQDYVEAFLESLDNYIDTHGVGTLQIFGESVSGKSFTSSQIASLMESLGKKAIYVPWVDVIRDAKAIGIVDEGRQFGELTPREFHLTSKLYLGVHQHLLDEARERKQPTCVIGETIGIPVVDYTDLYHRRYLDRGTTAITALAATENAYVAAIYAGQGVRESGKDFRSRIAQATSPEEVMALVEEYGVNVHDTDPEKVMIELQRSGAPVGVAAKIEDQVSETLIHLANRGVIEIPAKRRNLEFLRKKKKVRNRFIGEELFPFLLQTDVPNKQSEFSVPPDRAFIGFNRKIRGKVDRFDLDRVHYHKSLPPEDLVKSPRILQAISSAGSF